MTYLCFWDILYDAFLSHVFNVICRQLMRSVSPCMVRVAIAVIPMLFILSRGSRIRKIEGHALLLWVRSSGEVRRDVREELTRRFLQTFPDPRTPCDRKKRVVHGLVFRVASTRSCGFF